MKHYEQVSKKRTFFFLFFLFFFLIRDSFGIEGMKHFLGNDDKKIVGKVLKDIETIDEKDKKLTFCKLKFSIGPYEKLKENENNKVSELSKSVKDFFSFKKKIYKYIDAQRLNTNVKYSDLWSFSNFIFTKSFFSRRKELNSQLQEVDKQCH